MQLRTEKSHLSLYQDLKDGELQLMTFEDTESAEFAEATEFAQAQKYEARDAHEVLEVLQLGKKVEITFTDKAAANALRVRLHQLKAISEKNLIAIGFMDATEVQSLLMEQVQEPAFDNTYRFSFGTRKREGLKYTIRVLD